MQEYIRKLIFRFATGGGNCDPVVGQVKKYQEERMTTKSMTVTQRDMKRSQGGFTLIEIIAVLVILGILAAVAVPRFTDLQEQARTRALDGVATAAVSAVSMEYARQLLIAAGNPATAWTALGTTVTSIWLGNNVSLDGFNPQPTIAQTTAGNTMTITVTQGTRTATATFTNPNS